MASAAAVLIIFPLSAVICVSLGLALSLECPTPFGQLAAVENPLPDIDLYLDEADFQGGKS